MIKHTYIILCVAVLPTFTTLALVLSLVTYIQGERSRHYTIRRLRAIEFEVTYLIDEIVAVTELTTRSLAHTRARDHARHARLNTDRLRRPIANSYSNFPRMTPSSTTYHLSPLNTLSNTLETHLLPQTHLALRTLIHPHLTTYQINQIIHDFGVSIRDIHQPYEARTVDRSLIPPIATAFLSALTLSTSEIETAQLERIMKWLRSVLKDMCRDDDDMDSIRVNQSSPVPSFVSSNRGGDIGVSLSGSTLVQSESSDDEAGRIHVRRPWRAARFEVGG
jgi:hypothetical protein